MRKQKTKHEEDVLTFVLSTFAALVEARREVEPMWQEITDYLYPQRSGWGFEADTRLEAGELIFDGMPISAHAKLADGLFGWLVSPSIDWLKWVPKDPKLRHDMKVMAYCQDLEQALYDVFDASNFYDTMAQDIKDCSALGTSVIYGEEAKELGRPFFTPLHLREVYISENKYQEVDTLFRSFNVTYRVLVEMFGDTLDPDTVKAAQKAPETQVRLLHAIYPRTSGQVVKEYARAGFKSDKPFASVYLMQGTATAGSGMAAQVQGATLLEEGGLDYKHFEAWRFEKASGQTYGTCPAMDAIFDTKMLNLQAKTMADTAELAAAPPMQAPESMRGKIKIYPRGMSYFTNENQRVSPIMTSVSYPFGVDSMERTANNIKEHFKTAYFQSVSQIQQGSRERTRTEILEMKAESASILGSIVGRIQKERIEPMVHMTMAIEAAAGRLPRPPQGIDPDIALKLSLRGPLAQSQRKFLQVDGITKGLGAAMQIQAMNPDVGMNFKTNAIARTLALANDFPIDMLNDEAEVTKAQAQAQQQRAQAAQMQMENARMVAQSAGTKQVEPGSPAAQTMPPRRS